MANYGICKLTGVEGKFVKSHLRPQAFTIYPNVDNKPFAEADFKVNKDFKRARGSWYDKKLVTAEGEAISLLWRFANTNLNRNEEYAISVSDETNHLMKKNASY